MIPIKKIIYLYFVAMIFSSAIYASTYNPIQLQQFQTTGSCPSCDLTDDDITVNYGVVAPYNLQDANLSGSTMEMTNDTLSNFSGAIAIESSFAGCYSQTNFENAVLINADFQQTDLTYSNFTNANVTGANFSNADLYGSQGINFSEAYSVCNAVMPDGSKGACS